MCYWKLFDRCHRRALDFHALFPSRILVRLYVVCICITNGVSLCDRSHLLARRTS
jgi:hypothetical protein